MAGVTLVTSSSTTADLEAVKLGQSTPARSRDPLSKLDPDALASASPHLQHLTLPQLVRSYLIFLACSSSLLVKIAPATIDTLETIRDTVPLGLGHILWQPFVFVMRHTFFAQFVAGETAAEADPLLHTLRERSCGAMLNWSAEAVHQHGPHRSTGVLPEAVQELTQALEAISRFQPASEPVSTFLAVKITGLLADEGVFERASSALRASTSYSRGEQLTSQALIPTSPSLYEDDLNTINELYKQLRQLCGLAKKHRIRIAFDAEQSWLQPCLDRMVSMLSAEFNRSETPVLYNTYQANLREIPGAIQRDLQQAKDSGYILGVKLVRGAYVEAENARAKADRTESPVWGSKAETDKCFDECAQLLIDELVKGMRNEKPVPHIILATHNPISVKKALNQLREAGLAGNKDDHLDIDSSIRGRLIFAQLMAMADSLTSTLLRLLPKTGRGGFEYPMNSLYVPYGKIDRVLPYLVRRAQENTSIMAGSDPAGKSGAAGQRRAIGREIRHRLFPSLF